jgi:hypothetical protein
VPESTGCTDASGTVADPETPTKHLDIRHRDPISKPRACTYRNSGLLLPFAAPVTSLLAAIARHYQAAMPAGIEGSMSERNAVHRKSLAFMP